ncbi:Hypothetical protein ORPV_1062 [Orpheovirus IHUMI-LCC2]|uniref:Mrr-like domain-containing protein n=1 Tax=Orpheovirus IHUMI-LCC2 TaxID=2023057 RepID=A0A2I2L623_9VIRU|nr:Hypothetical protein ORPV_1062 [Orpheovirus IHUMI-LCC2]SNW62966.1 Hypothetical protein ORPV_1062 [Orpheovirus IHUMI-LCC2]
MWKKYLNECLKEDNGKELFEELQKKIEDHFNHSCSSMSDIERKKRTELEKGIWWEEICVLWLHVTTGNEVWRLKDIPKDIKERLRIEVDYGIDGVMKELCKEGEKYHALQFKYRNKDYVSYGELSTFYSTCYLTGPYSSHIIMTNCKGVSHKKGVPKDPKEKVIARGTFSGKNSKWVWCKIVNIPIISTYQPMDAFSKLGEGRVLKESLVEDIGRKEVEEEKIIINKVEEKKTKGRKKVVKGNVLGGEKKVEDDNLDMIRLLRTAKLEK